ncbi:MAG: hypothetical protein JNL35_10590 [Sphingopyxis sp.]|nr:hypothetical protein [Sphingopyxis sp.]
MTDHQSSDRRDRKCWSPPQIRQIVPTRRTRGGSGEQNGDTDDIIYDLS